MIIFLFSGQSRTSPFSKSGNKIDNEILESYNKFIFTDIFKNTYDYKIYISTDNIDLESIINYFTSEKIGNIHLLDTDYYLKPVTPLKPVKYYLDQYDAKDWSNYRKYDNSVHQHYKLLDSYNLFEQDQLDAEIIVRIRLDYAINQDIISLIKEQTLKTQTLIYIHWDFFALGKPDIMKCYCTCLENMYKYSFKDREPLFWENYNYLCKQMWTYAPERQLFEMLFEYCDKNNKCINLIKSIVSFEDRNIGLIR